MGTFTAFYAPVAAAVLAVAGCGGGHDNGGGKTVDEYVKQECAFMADFNGKFQKLLHEYTVNAVNANKSAANQTALADTVDAIGNLYDDFRVKSKELGDSPTGEDRGDDAEAVVKTAIAQFHDIASSIRVATTASDLEAAAAKIPQLAERMVKQGAEMKAKNPTPKLDEARKAVPGCSELFGG